MIHYTLESLGDGDTSETACSFDRLMEFFPSGADEMNWLFGSTSGVHGSYDTLDSFWDAGEGIWTFVIVQPRRVTIRYGNVWVQNLEQLDKLRRLVDQTLSAVIRSQDGNRKPRPPVL